MANKLKIAYVLDDSLDSTDGVQQYVLTISEWMKSQGHDCHFLVGHTERTDIENVHSISKVLKVRFNKNRMSTPLPARTAALKELFEKEHYDIVHVQMPYSPFLAGRVLKSLPAETAAIGTFHILPFGRLHKTANQLLGKALRSSLSRFDVILSVSAAAQKFAAQSYNISSDVLPNAVNARQFIAKKSLKKHPKLRIVFLGRLVERKGAKELLRAMVLLQQEHPGLMTRVECVIGGKGAQKTKLEQFARTHRIDHLVEFIGFVDESDKAALLSNADIAVFPSLGGESFGIVLIEAMTAGSGVVLGGDNPGYRSVLGEKPQLLFNPSNSKEFAARIHEMITDTSQREQLHRWQQKHVRQYDVAHVGPKLLSYYQQAIRHRGAK
jgi:phosphatidylinositol alpha-mannosyltransferase